MFRQQEAQLTQTQNPYIFLKGVTHKDLTSLVEFMYQGEVNVEDQDLDIEESIEELARADTVSFDVEDNDENLKEIIFYLQ